MYCCGELFINAFTHSGDVLLFVHNKTKHNTLAGAKAVRHPAHSLFLPTMAMMSLKLLLQNTLKIGNAPFTLSRRCKAGAIDYPEGTFCDTVQVLSGAGDIQII